MLLPVWVPHAPRFPGLTALHPLSKPARFHGPVDSFLPLPHCSWLILGLVPPSSKALEMALDPLENSGLLYLQILAIRMGPAWLDIVESQPASSCVNQSRIWLAGKRFWWRKQFLVHVTCLLWGNWGILCATLTGWGQCLLHVP